MAEPAVAAASKKRPREEDEADEVEVCRANQAA
jgi:hypothetical protein